MFVHSRLLCAPAFAAHQSEGCGFGLGGAGQATVCIHPFVHVGSEIEHPATLDEFGAFAVAAHHGERLFGETRVNGCVASIHAAIRKGDYLDVVDFGLRHESSIL